MATETSEGSVEAYTELEHFQRLQPPRERASDAGAALIGAFAIVFGLAAFYFSPLKLGVLAIALAIVAMGVSGGRNTTAPLLLPAQVVPVVIKSLVFPTTTALGRKDPNLAA